MIDSQFLKSIPLFYHLSDEEIAHIQGALEKSTLQPNEVLFNMGEAGDELYIVQSGRLAIYTPNQGAPAQGRPIRIIEAGEILGEMALIDKQPRSLSARALESTEVFVLTGAMFRHLLTIPGMALNVMSGLSDRIRYTTEFLSEVRGWVQRVAMGKYDHAFNASQDYTDQSIVALASEFTQMATQVQQREEVLRQEVMQLRIEIDDARRKRHVEEITGSDYFQSLREQARRLRRNPDENK